jgi:2,3-dihydroxyphenylpropionate 1,2-dioxygenase
LRAAILAIPDARRIAIIATGGLSHSLPFPDWRRPNGSDEIFLANSWSVGRDNWQAFEQRRRSILLSAAPRINPSFDEWFLQLLEADGLADFGSRLSDEQLLSQAGNGGNEVRSWLALASAMGNQAGRTIAYSPMPEWLTGMAVAVIEPNAISGECS